MNSFGLCFTKQERILALFAEHSKDLSHACLAGIRFGKCVFDSTGPPALSFEHPRNILLIGKVIAL